MATRPIPSICGDRMNPYVAKKSCGDPLHIDGVEDVTINQGMGIDLTAGVTAYDSDGSEIEFTVSPSEIDACDVGEHTVTYTAVGKDSVLKPTICGSDALATTDCGMGIVEETRLVTIEQADPPTISGITPLEVGANESFNPLEGVTAEDDNGNTLTVIFVPAAFSGTDDATINQGVGIDLREGVHALDTNGNVIPFTVSPSEIAECDVGTHTVTYTSARATETRMVTIHAISNPTISGASTALVEMAGEEFDPLDGVTAVDGNGNPITDITVELVS